MPEPLKKNPANGAQQPGVAQRVAAPAIVVQQANTQQAGVRPKITVTPMRPGEDRIPVRTAKFQFIAPKPNTITTSQILDGDYIDITKPVMSNEALQDYELSHVATLRPEIIAATELYPVYPDQAATGENLTKVGKLITFQYQSQQLKAEILKQLVGQVADQLAANAAGNTNILDSFDSRYTMVATAKNELNLVGSTQNALREILNFRSILSKTITIPGNTTIGDTSAFGIIRRNVPYVISVREFVQRITGYSQAQFDSFTNTKIFMTLCSDLEQAMSDGVFGNISTETDPDRTSDLDPTSIDLTHTTNSTIDVELLNASFGQAGKTLMVDPSKFNAFQKSLSKDQYQKMIVLLNFLSKELLYSSYLYNLGKQTNLTTSGNFFNTVFGKPGSTIFDKISGDKSVVTIASLQDVARNATILPFENVYIENNTGKSQLSAKYIPGKRYFVDSIIDGVTTNAPDLNTKPIVDYSNRSQSILNDTTNVLNQIKNIRNSYFLYNGSSTYKYILSQLDASTAGLQYNNRVVKQQAIAMAIFKTAADDSQLKLMLFQYLLYVGIYLRKNAQNQNQYVVFDNIANELGTTNNLTFLNGGRLLSASTYSSNKKIDALSFVTVTKSQNSIMAEHIRSFARSIAKYLAQSNLTNRRGTPVRTTNEFLTEVTEDTIAEFLITPIKTSLFVPKGTIYYDFFDFIQCLDNIISIGYFSNAGGTKFKGVSATNLAYIIFEIFVTTASIFSYCKFALSRSTEYQYTNTKVRANILVNWYKHGLSREKVQLLVGRTGGVSESSGTVITPSTIPGKKNILNLDIFNKLKRVQPTTYDILRIVASQQGSGTSAFSQTNNNNGIVNPSNATIEFNFTIVPPTVFPTATKDPGLLSDIYLLYGDQIKDGIQFLPKNGAKVYEVYNKLWDEDWYYPTMINGFIGLLNTNLCVSIKNTIKPITNPGSLPTIRGTKLRPEVENLRIFDQAFTDYATLRGYTIPSGVPSKNDLQSFFGRLAPSQLKLQMLLQMFKESSFLPVGEPTQTRVRVLSVGVPNGMVDSLNERKLLSSINSKTVGRRFFTTQDGIENDVIKINVYRRDLRFNGLVFKPKAYYFDTSLFINETSITELQQNLNSNSIVNPNSLTFDELVNKTTFYDYDNSSAFQPKNVTSIDNQLATNFNNGNFQTTNYLYGTNLPTNVRFEILRNTMQSFLLQSYIAYVTGMTIDEKSFSVAVDNGNQASTNTIALGNTFIKETLSYLKSTGEPIRGNTIQDALNSPISAHAKLLLQLVQESSTVIDPGVIYSRLANNPLAFDRVFHVVETADAYEIDVERTKQTKEGLALLSSDKFVESLIRLGESYFLPFTGMSDVSLSDYFIDIEVSEF